MLKLNWKFLLATLLIFHAANSGFASYKDPIENNNNAPDPQPLALVQTVGAEDSLSLLPRSNFQLIPVNSKPNNLLGLRHVCSSLMTPEAGEAFNNVFTNLAYAQTCDLYAKHGDRLVEPFSQYMIGLSYEISKAAVLRASGMQPIVSTVSKTCSSFNKLTGYDISVERLLPFGKQDAVQVLHKSPEFWVGILRLKFLTDSLNRRLVGPQLVAPTVAYGVNQMNLGRTLQQNVFGSIIKGLDDYNSNQHQSLQAQIEAGKRKLDKLEIALELARIDAASAPERRASQIKELQGQIDQKREQLKTALVPVEKENQDLSYTRRALSWTASWVVNVEPDNIVSLRKELSDLEASLKKLDSEKDSETQAIRNIQKDIENTEKALANMQLELLTPQEYLQFKNEPLGESAQSALELLRGLEVCGYQLGAYMEPCPHLESGMLSNLLTLDNAKIAGSGLMAIPYQALRLTGTLDAIQLLRQDFESATLQHKFNRVTDNITRLLQKDLSEELGRVELKITARTAVHSAPNLLRGATEMWKAKSWGEGFEHAQARASEVQEIAVRKTLEVAHEEVHAIAGPIMDHAIQIRTHASDVVQGVRMTLLVPRLAYNTFIYTSVFGAGNYLTGFIVETSTGLPGIMALALIWAILGEMLSALV